MQNNNELTDQDASPADEGQKVAGGNENRATGGTTRRRERKSRRLLGNLVQGFQTARHVLTGNGATASQATTTLAPVEIPVAPVANEEMERETSQADELTIDVAKWARRLLIPLAIIAWFGVGILLLWVAGHVSKTILLLIIAALLHGDDDFQRC